MTDSADITIAVAALAAVSSILGIGVSELFAILREGRRADADAKEEEAKRLHDLRRDVFLAAAGSTVRMFASLGRMNDPQVPNVESGRAAEEFNKAFARVNLVAKPGTIRRASELQRALMQTHLELVALRVPLMTRQLAIELAKKNAEAHNNDFQRFLEMLKMLNINGQGNDPRFDAVERQANIANENMLTEANKLQQLLEEQAAAQQSFLEKFIPRLEGLAKLQIDALIAIRSDMGIDDAVDVLRQEMTTNLDAMRESVSKIFRKPPDADDGRSP